MAAPSLSYRPYQQFTHERTQYEPQFLGCPAAAHVPEAKVLLCASQLLRYELLFAS